MSSSGASTQICYFACHRRNLDDKRRVQIPSKWIGKSDDGKIIPVTYALLLWEHDGQPDMCLQVLPPDKFQEFFREVTSVRFGDTAGQALKRALAEKMETVELDSAGRIVLPEWLAAGAGLAVGKEAVLNGMFDCFQIWAPERYEATRASVAAKTPNAFRQIL